MHDNVKIWPVNQYSAFFLGNIHHCYLENLVEDIEIILSQENGRKYTGNS
ncbi:hypothetical protein SAMN05216326_1032 [Nitrosomonas marina]|uniref:Uncharacterized protein n=1 Tax=Nitrosomonas marina TaxID=917 RepID=A0A1H9YXW2_9PROT|nr:hypothetical protein SAMN05216326_1032 [Nitrosomonas marina]